MFTSSGKAGNTLKVILASLLLAATMISTVGCDIIGSLQDAVEPQLQETTEAFTYPEIETERYQTLEMEELGVDLFESFDLSKALSGYYYQYYLSEVEAKAEECAQEGSKMNTLMSKKYRENAEGHIVLQQKATDGISNLLNNQNKNLKINFSLTNSIYTSYSLIVNDEQGIFLLLAKDNYKGTEVVLTGIANGEFYNSSEWPFITEDNSQAVQVFLQNHQFSELSTNLLAFLPAHIMVTEICFNTGQTGNNTATLNIAMASKGSLTSQQKIECSILSMFQVLLTDNKISEFNIASTGVVVGDMVKVPAYSKLVSVTFEEGLSDQLINKALSQLTVDFRAFI